jgi:hypothetical protein
MAVGAAGHHHAAGERFVIYGPAGALWAAGAREAGMTGAAGLVAASGSGLVHYPLPAEPPATS